MKTGVFKYVRKKYLFLTWELKVFVTVFLRKISKTFKKFKNFTLNNSLNLIY